jgi:hypothetical protein
VSENKAGANNYMKYLSYLTDHVCGKQSLKRTLGINLPMALLFPLLLAEFDLLRDANLLYFLFLFWGWGLLGVLVKCIKNLINYDKQDTSVLYRFISFLLTLTVIWFAVFVVLDVYLP